jgi:hypothetical protein
MPGDSVRSAVLYDVAGQRMVRDWALQISAVN